MRMYAACLASYNNGVLHGEWFDLEDYSDADDLKADIASKVLRTSPYPNVTVECPECDGPVSSVPGCDAGDWQCPCCDGSGRVPSAEEWAAHDWDGEGLSEFGEYPNLEEVLEYVQAVEEHGEAWHAYVSHVGAHTATPEGFVESTMGDYGSKEEWAEEYLEESGQLSQIPKELRGYIDFEAYARDTEMNGGLSFVEHSGRVYVFSG